MWWVKYYENGRPRRESTGTIRETEAKRFLKGREGRVATGQPILQRADRILYEEVEQDLRQYYQTTGSRDLKEAEYRVKHLEAFFGGRRATIIAPAEITNYAALRQRAGASNSTINRDLAVLNGCCGSRMSTTSCCGYP
jgi:hypothetical protein